MFDLQTLPLKDFTLQSKDPSRATLVDCARTGRKALMLTTMPGDIDIAYSGKEERCDYYHTVRGTLDPYAFGEGDDIWVAHSIMFPDTFKAPFWHPYIVFDFHGVGKGPLAAIQASMHLCFRRWPNHDDAPGVLQLQRFYGNPAAPSEKYVTLGVPVRNTWYDFMYHFVWSSGAGLFEAWLNKVKLTTQKGPTLYDTGERVGMKLANYHLPWSDQPDVPSSVIHDRIAIGATRAELELSLAA